MQTIVHVISNHFPAQQERGTGKKQQNTLVKGDIHRIFDSALYSKHTSQGYRNRVLFALELCLGRRTTALWQLTATQLKERNMRGLVAWVFTDKVVSVESATKGKQGDMAAVNTVLHVIHIYDINMLSGNLNVHKIVDDYMRVRPALDMGPD